MKSRNIAAAASVLTSVALGLSCSGERSSSVEGTSSTAELCAEGEGRAAKGEWPYYGADPANSKYSRLTQITRENVKRLAPAWVWESPDNDIVENLNQNGVKIWPHAYETSPLMVNGVLYASTSLGQVTAIDAAEGKTRWVFDTKSYLASDGTTVAFPPNIGFVARGVAYWQAAAEARIFFGTGAGELIALDLDGKLVSGFGAGGRIDLKQGLRAPAPQPFYSVTSPPIVCGDTVIVGSCVLDFPLTPQMPPGDVRGFDARTGELLWTFHTVAQSGEVGNETWKDEAWRTTGGANVWAPMSCDPELQRVPAGEHASKRSLRRTSPGRWPVRR